MKLKNPFKDLTKFELSLWLTSIIVIIVSFAVSGGDDVLTIIASLIGVTALIFVAKGYVIGQVLTVVFAVFYGIISYFFRYYGEMITYLCAQYECYLPQVKVSHVTKKQVLVMATLAIVTTIIFYFILKAMNNANLLFSTISITTSFLASYLTFLRSPYYAVAYSANDVVLIVLWTMATLEDRSYLPMILCFVMFLINDMYGFFNWRRMRIRQENI